MLPVVGNGEDVWPAVDLGHHPFALNLLGEVFNGRGVVAGVIVATGCQHTGASGEDGGEHP